MTLLSLVSRMLVNIGLCRVPFCMWLVNQAAKSTGAFKASSANSIGLESMRRYEIAQIFAAAGERLADWHTDIDIVDAVKSEQRHGMDEIGILISDAELIHMVLDVVRSIDAVRACDVEVRLSHSGLLLAILDYVGAPASSQSRFLQSVMSYQHSHVRGRNQKTDRRQRAWADLCQAMQELKIPIGRAKTILQQRPTNAAECVRWLQSILSSTGKSCIQALHQLEALIDLLSAWDVFTSEGVTVTVDPFMPLPATYCHSLIYEVHVMIPWSGIDRELMETKSACELICSGGRYDALLKGIWPWQLRNENIPALLGTGVTIDMTALERFAQVLDVGRQHVLLNHRTLSAAEILVAARGGGGMMKERCKVLQLLWRAGLSAETIHAADPSLMEQFTHAKARGMRCVVLLTQDQLEVKGQVKVCQTLTHVDAICTIHIVLHYEVLAAHYIPLWLCMWYRLASSLELDVTVCHSSVIQFIYMLSHVQASHQHSECTSSFHNNVSKSIEIGSVYSHCMMHKQAAYQYTGFRLGMMVFMSTIFWLRTNLLFNIM